MAGNIWVNVVVPELSLPILSGLFGLALVAGAIDAMAGGGGLLTVPGLMVAGLNPVSVLATNKVQGIFGPFGATIHFRRNGAIRLRENMLPMTAAFIGALGGAASLSTVNPKILKTVVPYLLIAIALWVLFSPKLGTVERMARIPASVCFLTFVPIVAFYDGFFGPGTGTFFSFGLVSLLGLSLQDATVRAKLYNFASNAGALSYWISSGHIAWTYGVVMAAGMLIGGNIGARLVLKHGAALIKPVLVAVSLAMSVRILLS